ncbi:MAG: low molecular weight phosphotyrosine protein phosphatase, partial [Pseudomonadota bacterium]
ARQVDDSDGFEFDHILAMDASNLADLRERRLPGWSAEVRMLLKRDVPDPYYGGNDGFEKVLNLLEDGIDQLIRELQDHA